MSETCKGFYNKGDTIKKPKYFKNNLPIWSCWICSHFCRSTTISRSKRHLISTTTPKCQSNKLQCVCRSLATSFKFRLIIIWRRRFLNDENGCCCSNLFWGDVKESRFRRFAGQVCHDSLPFFISHLWIDRLGNYFLLGQMFHLS